MKFKKGDRVVVVTGKHYAITDYGSRGVVTEEHIRPIVEFTYISGHKSFASGITYSINQDHLEFEEVFGSPLYEALK